MLRRSLAVLALPLIVCLTLVSPAHAAHGNGHFIKNATSATLSGSSLVVHFKEAGLSSGAVETIQTSATATTTYECVNGGGHNPSASNKTTTVTQASQTGTFTADQNGNLVSTQTLSAPSASSLGFSCPPGQTVTFVGVSYSNVMINDLTSGASLALPGTFTYTNPLAP